MPQEGITIKEDQTLLNARFTGKQTRVFYNPFSEMRYVTESCLNFTSFKEDVWVLLAMWQKRLLPIINKIAPFHLIFELCIFGMLFGAAMLSGGGAIPLAIVGAIWGAAFGILEFVAISVHHKVIQHAGTEGCFIGVPFMYIHDQWTNDFLEIDITNTQTMVAAGVDTERGSALLAIAQKRQMVKFKVMLYGTGWGGRYMTKRWMNCFTAFMRFTCGVASAFFSFLYACGAGDVTHVLGFGLCGWCWFIILAEIGWAIWKFMH